MAQDGQAVVGDPAGHSEAPRILVTAFPIAGRLHEGGSDPRLTKHFREIAQQVGAALQEFRGTLEAATKSSEGLSEIKLTLQLTMAAETNWVIAKGTAEAGVQIEATWKL